jgi:hypothetical protein
VAKLDAPKNLENVAPGFLCGQALRIFLLKVLEKVLKELESIGKYGMNWKVKEF